jgi:hypothetical protein
MYAVLVTILLTSGQPHTYAVPCPDLTCVAYVMVAANEGGGLSRVRVTRGSPGTLPGGGKRTIFPAWIDYSYL